MTSVITTEHEQQRVTHLVLGLPRPKAKTSGRRSKRKPAPIVQLAPDIEARVKLREDWSHKANGTPETHEHAFAETQREGSLARLLRSAAIDAHQLAAAEEIRLAHDEVTADVAVRTARWERSSGGGYGVAIERLGQAVRARAYSQWREAVAPHAAMALAIIVDDVGLTQAARKWRVSNRRARRILIESLDRWRRG